VTAGFDGVYLDKVDAFEEMGHKDAMCDFVGSHAARSSRSERAFSSLRKMASRSSRTPSFAMRSTPSRAKTCFLAKTRMASQRSGSHPRQHRRAGALRRHGKPVLVVEYPRNEQQARSVRREIAEQGFIGLVARRDLDTL
jgi:endo-alpha-1,4-polygalactosaminidase (GH114 family)